VEREFQSADAALFFTGDTVRWQQFGPYHGQRFQIGSLYSPEIGGDGGTVAEYRMDYRKYMHMSRRSLLAYRLFGVVSNASDTDFRRIYSAGGLNTIRGFGYRDIIGDRLFFQNFEVRFPLVDRLQLPFGSFTSIRGLLFLDIGGGYFEGGEWFDQDSGLFVFKNPAFVDDMTTPNPGRYTDAFGNPRQAWDFWDSKENRLNNGVAAFGIGVNVRLGFLELNWVFSRRTNFSDTDKDWSSTFYIGNKF
jgi:outer membrane protein assembly factor BamA